MYMQALPIFLDRLADPVTAVLISITVVLIFGGSPTDHAIPTCEKSSMIFVTWSMGVKALPCSIGR